VRKYKNFRCKQKAVISIDTTALILSNENLWEENKKNENFTLYFI
jgi:hypothetical protein